MGERHVNRPQWRRQLGEEAMSHFKYVVFTAPAAGQEDAYNDWYDNHHLAEVLQVEGFVAAQRFKIVETDHNSQPASRYLAIYEIEADDPKTVLDRLVEIGTGGGMVISDALDRASAKTILYQPIGERMVKGGGLGADATMPGGAIVRNF
jgi:hypothetical protein